MEASTAISHQESSTENSKIFDKDIKRPVRARVYEIVDELNILDTTIWKRLHSKEVRSKFKKLKGMLNAL